MIPPLSNRQPQPVGNEGPVPPVIRVCVWLDMPAHFEYIVCMQYTIRKVPPEVDKALRRKARKEGRSLNDIAVEALARGAGIDATIMKNHHLDFVIGTWVEDPEFDNALDDQRQIDPDLWK